jgi:hypothetical protein
MSSELQGSMYQCQVVLACLKLRQDGILKWLFSSSFFFQNLFSIFFYSEMNEKQIFVYFCLFIWFSRVYISVALFYNLFLFLFYSNKKISICVYEYLE